MEIIGILNKCNKQIDAANTYEEQREVVKPLIELLEKFINKLNKNDIWSMEYIDSLSGFEFEKCITELLLLLGYKNVIKTNATGDYGVDILAEQDNQKIAIQCKRYSTTVGNKAVQEIYTGKEFYNCTKGIIITNNFFTSQAIQQANSLNEIYLWDRNVLIQMINDMKTKNLII